MKPMQLSLLICVGAWVAGGCAQARPRRGPASATDELSPKLQQYAAHEASWRSLLLRERPSAEEAKHLGEAVRVAGELRQRNSDAYRVLPDVGIPWDDAPPEAKADQARRGLPHHTLYYPLVWTLIRADRRESGWAVDCLLFRVDVSTEEGRQRVYNIQCVLIGLYGPDVNYILAKRYRLDSRISREVSSVGAAIRYLRETLDDPHPVSGSRWEKAYALSLYERYYEPNEP
ncbi:MAG: hypothetical protein FJ290_08700 [Planctomycetes bacterium]|nr:hypothetical protein [Planctomycetota bacterium]